MVGSLDVGFLFYRQIIFDFFESRSVWRKLRVDRNCLC